MDEDRFTPRAHGVVRCGADQANVLCRIAHAGVNTVQARGVWPFPPVLRLGALRNIKQDACYGAGSTLGVVSRHHQICGEPEFKAPSGGARFGEVNALLEDCSDSRVRCGCSGYLVARGRVRELLDQHGGQGGVIGAKRQPPARVSERNIGAERATVDHNFRFVFSGHGAIDTTALKNREVESMPYAQKPLPCEGRLPEVSVWKDTTGPGADCASAPVSFPQRSPSVVQDHQRALPMLAGRG